MGLCRLSLALFPGHSQILSRSLENNGKVETEFHFVMECSKLQKLQKLQNELNSIKKQRASTDTCLLANAHVYRFLWSAGSTTIQLTIPSGFIKKQRTTTGKYLW